MKSLFAMIAVLFATSTFAQKHMVEFNADTFLFSRFTFSNDKNKGESSTEDKFGFIYANYAYAITSQVQIGTQGNYSKYRYSEGTNESYAILLGAIYNFNSDLANSIYLSVYAGMEWDHNYDKGSDNTHEEAFITTASLGKRFPLTMLKLDNVTYSPEITFQNTSATRSQSNDWEQELSFKFLQFSILF